MHHHRISWRWLAGLLAALLLGAGTARAAAPLQSAPDQPAPTPLASERPDACAPNDVPERACVLARDRVSGPFTFMPEGQIDYYSINLDDPPIGDAALTITLRGTAGLDLLARITRAGEQAPVATIASPTIAATLPDDLRGWLVLRVENRSPAALGERYTIELREQPAAPPEGAPPDTGVEQAQPDPLENNWSPASAAPIGVGVVYDLTFACPVAGGCAGGDHDYLAAPVKAGARYLLATLDLGPGVDTVIDLFWGDMARPLAASDDLQGRASFLSMLRWDAPADGTLLIRVGPRTGGVVPRVFSERAGRYRFVIALAGSELAQQIERQVADQTSAPTPAAGAGAPGQSPQAGQGGPARVTAPSTALRAEPDPAAQVIEQLPEGSVVTLLGEVRGLWARAQSQRGVIPGWVYGPDLQRAGAEAALPIPPTAAPGEPPSAPAPTPAAAGPPGTPPLPQAREIEPLPIPPAADARPLPLAVAVTIGRAGAGDTAAAGTSDMLPLANLRVALRSAVGDLLAEALTDASGQALLSCVAPPGAQVVVQVAALGIEYPVDRASPTITIRVPRTAEGVSP